MSLIFFIFVQIKENDSDFVQQNLIVYSYYICIARAVTTIETCNFLGYNFVTYK